MEVPENKVIHLHLGGLLECKLVQGFLLAAEVVGRPFGALAARPFAGQCKGDPGVEGAEKALRYAAVEHL